MAENKIARICWNTEGWHKPSGKAGKSKNMDAYECIMSFGHEEWLLDTTKLIDGWHYAYLQPIGSHRSTYIGQIFNISLYAINEETKERWWIGQICNVEVTTPEESRKVYSIYEENYWFREMEEQLRNVGADFHAFREIQPENFAVIRFYPKSLRLLDTPKKFSTDDPAVTMTRYNLLNQKRTPKFLASNNKFEFSPGHTKKKDSAKSTYKEQSSDIDLFHNRMQNNIFQQLEKKFGEENVGTEKNIGYGAQIDLVVKDSQGSFIFYEFKTSCHLKLCIREALSQLLEYAYYPNANNAKRLIIVSPNEITNDARTYMETLRNKFNIPVFYQHYDSETGCLEDDQY